MAAQQTNKSLNSDSLQVDIFYPLISYTHLQQQDLWVYIKKKKVLNCRDFAKKWMEIVLLDG